MRLKFTLSSLTFAHALIPYVGMPNDANREKYDATDVANATFPSPSGANILDTYGYVIKGKMNDDIFNIVLKIKLILIDFFTRHPS